MLYSNTTVLVVFNGVEKYSFAGINSLHTYNDFEGVNSYLPFQRHNKRFKGFGESDSIGIISKRKFVLYQK